MASEVIGFVGLGTMGASMAATCRRRAIELVVHDLHRQAASHVLDAGATWAETPRALAAQSDVIFTSLPEPPDVEAVALGAGRAACRREAGRGVLRSLDQCAGGGEEAARGLRREGRAHARRAGERRTEGRRIAQARDLGRRRARRCSTSTRPCSTRSATRRAISGRSARRPSPSWCTTCRATRSSARWPRRLHDGRQGRRRAARAVEGGAPGRAGPALHLRRAGRPVPARQPTIRPHFALKLAHKDVSLANALGRELGVPMRMCNLALRRDDRGDGTRLGRARFARRHAAAAGARRRRDRGRARHGCARRSPRGMRGNSRRMKATVSLPLMPAKAGTQSFGQRTGSPLSRGRAETTVFVAPRAP